MDALSQTAPAIPGSPAQMSPIVPTAEPNPGQSLPNDPQSLAHRVEVLKAMIGELDSQPQSPQDMMSGSSLPTNTESEPLNLQPLTDASQSILQASSAMQGVTVSMQDSLSNLSLEISQALKEIQTHISTVMTKESEPTEISGITELNKKLSSLEKTLMLLPDVLKNMERPETPLLDLKPIIDGLNKVQNAVKSIPVPVFNGRGIQTVTGTITTSPTTSTTATETSVTASTSTKTVLAANTSRKGAFFYSDSTGTLYLKLGATASTSSYTVQLQIGDYLELPNPLYTGIIDGIWTSTNGTVKVTELT